MALITVIGASGRQGMAQVKQALAAGYDVRAISRQPEPFAGAKIEGIESVEVVDAKTVKVTLSAANGNFLFNMAWGDTVIVTPENIENIKQMPVSTGAFKFVN